MHSVQHIVIITYSAGSAHDGTKEQIVDGQSRGENV